MSFNLIKRWDFLTEDWAKLPQSSVFLQKTPVGWRVTETFKDRIVFDHYRNINGTRNTVVDCSLVGLTLTALDKTLPVIITEGVSDFLALKLMFPKLNVVGHTRLRWSMRDIKFLSNFSVIYKTTDNDVSGIKDLSEAKTKFSPKKVFGILPYFSSSKDIADDYLRIKITPEFRNHVIEHYTEFLL